MENEESDEAATAAIAAFVADVESFDFDFVFRIPLSFADTSFFCRSDCRFFQSP